MERGQEYIEGVKSIDTRDKIRYNKDLSKWEAETTERTNMLFHDEDSAKKALQDIEEEKDKIKDVNASTKTAADQEEGGTFKEWRGLRYDPETDAFEVYTTRRSTMLFATPDEALDYLKGE